ncbi:MAG: hypothetical protein ACYDHZ_00455 [Dehalococcoidia bacterium]
MKITITGLPPEKMRYPGTHVDYYDKGPHACIDVIQQENPLHEYLLAIAALVKYVLIKARGISIDEIEQFDKVHGADFASTDPSAPYYYEVQFASIIENLMCNELGLKYHEYKASINPDFVSFAHKPNWSKIRDEAANE